MQNFAKRFLKYKRKFSWNFAYFRERFCSLNSYVSLPSALLYLSNLEVLLRGVNFSTNNLQCVENSTVVMVSVKPHLYTTVLEPFKVYFVIYSFQQGVPIKYIFFHILCTLYTVQIVKGSKLRFSENLRWMNYFEKLNKG